MTSGLLGSWDWGSRVSGVSGLIIKQLVGYGFRASTISGVKGHGVFKGLIKSWCIKGVY